LQAAFSIASGDSVGFSLFRGPLRSFGAKVVIDKVDKEEADHACQNYQYSIEVPFLCLLVLLVMKVDGDFAHIILILIVLIACCQLHIEIVKLKYTTLSL
jgi:hypothetical protein